MKRFSTALFGNVGYNLEPVTASALTFFPGWEFRISTTSARACFGGCYRCGTSLWTISCVAT